MQIYEMTSASALIFALYRKWKKEQESQVMLDFVIVYVQGWNWFIRFLKHVLRSLHTPSWHDYRL